MADEKRVRKLFQSGTITDNPLAIGATTINFAAAPGFATLAADEHIAIVLDPLGVDGAPEVVYITDYTAAATSATIARAQEGTTARAHNTGTAWLHGPTVRDQATGRVAFVTHTAGDITANGTAWANLNTALDLVVAAVAGDIIEVGLVGLWSNENQYGFVDFVSLVGGSPVTAWSNGIAPDNAHQGIMAFYGQPNVLTPVGGSIMRRCASGDISSGTITLRARVRTNTATNKVLKAVANNPLTVWAKNHGPQEA